MKDPESGSAPVPGFQESCPLAGTGDGVAMCAAAAAFSFHAVGRLIFFSLFLGGRPVFVDRGIILARQLFRGTVLHRISVED